MKSGLFATAAILGAVEAKKGNTPTAIFHGFGDQCINPGMKDFAKDIAEQTDAYAICVEVGNGAETSFFTNFHKQGEMACEAINSNPNFQGEFNVLGLSQGSLIARYVATNCNLNGTVRNWASVGGPNMGVMAIPHCFSGAFCNAINYVADEFVYFKLFQNIIAPAGYFRDPAQLERYSEDSVFLPYVNNEAGSEDDKALVKSKFTSLNNILLVMFDQDTMIHPKETAWFQQMDVEGNVMELDDTDFYNQDFIGLKEMVDAGKVTFDKIDGDHLQFSAADIQNTFVPFLLS